MPCATTARTTRRRSRSARAMFVRGLAPEGERVPVLVVGPSDVEAPDSSLSHMCALLVRTFGAAGPEPTFFVNDGKLEIDALLARVASLPRERPALVLATSFALVHCLDAMRGRTAALPPRSRVMQTGGIKGQSREVSAAELRGAVSQAFAVDERAVVGEYGMTELSSQFWEATLVDEAAVHGEYAEPPWARVVPVDPETLAPVADGAVGIARIEDLANVDSAFAVLTQDRVRRVGRPIRAAGTRPRGVAAGVFDSARRDALAGGRCPRPDERPMSRTVDERLRDVRGWVEAARAVHAHRARHVAAIAASTGLSPEGVELGFDCLERAATPEELRALVASAGDAPSVHVILSANVFVAPLRAIAIARAASVRVTVRPSSRDPTLAAALVAAAGDPAVSIATDRGLPAGADRIDVYGRDETIARVRSLARPGVVVRGHGAGLGVAFVADEWERAAEALAADVAAFDQRGCLSPRVAFVLGSMAQGEAFAVALHERLAALGSRVPRGALTPDERSEVVRWRDTLAFAGRVWGGADHAVALAAAELPLAVPPAGRHVLVVPVASAAEARDRLAPIARSVVTVGSRGSKPPVAIAPPHARLARLGRMQRPPLDGPVDKRSL